MWRDDLHFNMGKILISSFRLDIKLLLLFLFTGSKGRGIIQLTHYNILNYLKYICKCHVIILRWNILNSYCHFDMNQISSPPL